MSKYHVTFIERREVTVEVDAENCNEARDKAQDGEGHVVSTETVEVEDSDFNSFIVKRA